MEGSPATLVRSFTNGFPSFLPQEVENIKNPHAREMAMRIERIPVKISSLRNSIMSSCVKPLVQGVANPVVLLHGFDSSCLEWTYSYPLLEDAGLETWAVDILGWGFSDLGTLPSCDAFTKREHLYQLWKSYIKRPMILVGPSLGAAVAVDFAASHPEAVSKLILIGASVYSEGVGKLGKLPRTVAYAGVSLLKSMPLRLYTTTLAFKNLSIASRIDWTNVGRLHCLLPWWEDATINFMLSGGYDVISKIKKVKQKTVIIWGKEDQIVNSNLALRLHKDIKDSVLQQIPGSGHLPHVERSSIVVSSIVEFASSDRDVKDRQTVVM